MMENKDDNLRSIDELSEEELKELTVEYEQGEISVNDLFKKYRITGLQVSKLKSHLPNIDTDKMCPYCNVNMYRKPERYVAKHAVTVVYCPKCGHKEDGLRNIFLRCRCPKCTALRLAQKEKEELEKAEKIKKFVESHQKVEIDRSIEFSSLSFKEKLTVSAYCNYVTFLDDEGTFIIPKSRAANDKISPNSMLKDVLTSLLRKKVIIENPNIKESDCYVENGEVCCNANSYIMALKDLSDPITFKDNLKKIASCEYAVSASTEDVLEFWKDLDFHECVEHLQFYIRPLDDEYSPSKATSMVIESLLEKFPPAIVCCLLWSCCTRAIGDYDRGKISMLYARNKAISWIGYKAQELLVGERTYRPSRRESSLQQSIISVLFFKKVLNLVDDGFNTIPSLSYFESLGEDSKAQLGHNDTAALD